MAFGVSHLIGVLIIRESYYLGVESILGSLIFVNSHLMQKIVEPCTYSSAGKEGPNMKPSEQALRLLEYFGERRGAGRATVECTKTFFVCVCVDLQL